MRGGSPINNFSFLYKYKLIISILVIFLLIGTVSAANNATVVSDTIPSIMNASQSYPVNITMKNDGTTIWNESYAYRLGNVNIDAFEFNMTGRLYMVGGVSVNPGSNYIFNFTMTAPPVNGTYTPQFRMLRESVEWFGETLNHTTVVSRHDPVVNYTSNVTSGIAPFSVQFNDTSTNTLGRSWFFGDETYNQSWIQQNASSVWRGRFGHASVALPDESVLVIGGTNGTNITGDIWRSTNNGVTWTYINLIPQFGLRVFYSSTAAVTLPDGSIILAGGINATTGFNDTWRSVDNGVIWTQMNASGGWTPRVAHQMVVMPDGSIILMGGQTVGVYYNDTWRSTNKGATWTRMNASSGWSVRQAFGAVALSDGSVVMMGGTFNGSTGGGINDTWRSTNNGATWTLMNASSGWDARQYFTVNSLPDDSIVLIGGFNLSGNNKQDTWRSTNKGATWTQINSSNAWTGRRAHASVEMPNGTLMLTGGLTATGVNDTWVFNPAGSNTQNLTRTYLTVGQYNVSLQVYNTSGYSGMQQIIRSSIPSYTSIVGQYTVIKFNNTGSTEWTVPADVTQVDYLVVAGGGAGGDIMGGGGGAGGMLDGFNYSVVTGVNYTIKVGDGGKYLDTGGSPPALRGVQGQNSSFGNTTSNMTSVGGGGGSAHAFGNATNGGSGGGGGSNNNGGYSTGGTGIPGQGYAGGNSGGYWYYNGAGGGGAGQAGSDATALVGGNGGNGRNSSITGVNITYAGGGGGGGSKYGNNVNGTGGQGGGGNGGGGPGQSTNATNELGGGGGGVYHDYDYPANTTIDGTFGRGGSGIVILRYLTPVTPVTNFTSNVTIGIPSLPVQFNDTSTNSPSGWSWFFGDEPYNQSWVRQNISSGWAGRSNFAAVTLPDGSVVIMGGATNPAGYIYANDTWRSTDKGVTWVQQNASSGWSKRNGHAATVISNGSIILTGGYDNTASMNDVWMSSDKGVTWTRINSSAGWAGRTTHSVVTSPNGTLIIAGGFTGTSWANDVWNSVNNGSTWTQVNSSAGWVGRAYPLTVVATDGSIILMGGNQPGPIFQGDVWRSTNNGLTWIQQNASAPWARSWHTGVAMPDGSVLLMGGYNGFVDKNDVWRSINNGVTWTQINASAGWTAREALASTVLPDGSVLVLGGSVNNDVWRFQPVGSSVQNATHTYLSVQRYNVSLQSYNSAGYNNTRKIQYIDVGLLPVSSFSANEPSGFNGYITQYIQFINTSVNAPIAWNWSFRDVTGNNTEVWFSQAQTILYSFSTVGNYTIKLNVSNSYGYNITPGDYWINLSNPITPPIAQFSGTPVIGAPPLSVLFTDASSFATGWAWFFDDETYNQSWYQINASSGWLERSKHSTVVLRDGKIILTGGRNISRRMNDTWRSIDYGKTWVLVNSSSGWTPRYGHVTVLLPDESIMLMGGYDSLGSIKNDTWRSTDAGITWTLVNSSSGWSGRYAFSGVALQDIPNTIIIMGGTNGTLLNDTWQSIDKGATWTQQSTSAGWAARNEFSSVVMQDGSIVLMGGHGTPIPVYYNDVWRSTDKGVTWVQQTPSSMWTDRAGFTTARMPDNSIVLMGGENYLAPSIGNDVWRSSNYGVTWAQINVSAGWSQRSSFSSVIMPNCSIMIFGGEESPAGPYLNDTWLFNPVSSTIQDPSHLFMSSGYYDVSLRVYNFNGYNTTVKYSYINAIGTTAAFNITPNPAQLGTPIVFVDMSSNSPTSWNWSLGDGNYSNNRNVTYIYPTIGVFTVKLNASNIYGFSNVSQNVTIYPAAPVANFTVDHNIGSVPLTVQFTDTSGVGITSWFWNFDDGGTSAIQDPPHTYLALGTYHAQLTVGSSVGTNVSQPVTIYVVNSAVPIADFSGAPTSGSAPLSVQFTDLSVALSGVNAWNWSFGDGNYSNVQNPVHIYSSGGQYTVMLTAISGAFSNYTAKVGYINIGIPSSSVSANFTANATYAAQYPATIQFYDSSVCNPVCTNWAWDFNGDGSTDSLLQNPVYTYTYPGNYSPKLVVSNGINAGTKIRNQYIIIGPVFVQPTIPQPTSAWVPGYQYNGSIWEFRGTSYVDLPNSTFLKYWLQNFSATGNFSVYGFATGLMAPIMHVFGFWIFLIIWGLYLFAVWIRSQDVTLPLIIGILTMGTFGLLFPKESLPVIIIMFVICGGIIITKLMKDSI